MKRQKGFSIILIIPIIALVLAIAGVFTYKLYSEGTRAKAEETPIPKILPPLPEASGKPSVGYGSVKGPTPKVTAPTTISLDDLLNETEDGGEADLKALEASASGL